MTADRLAEAERLARSAGALALEHWRRRDALVIETKAGRLDLVSEADRAVERHLRTGIRAAFPDDAILGEEYGAEAGGSGFTWVIDPIDGTAPYLQGLPHWCTALGLTRGAETVAGVIAVPTQDEVFAARLGHGATLNGRRLRIPAELDFAAAAIGVGASHRTDPAAVAGLIARLLAAGGMFYRNGSGALMLASVAAGRLAGYVEPHMHAWDCLAGLLMIREAGGRTAPLGSDDPLAGGYVRAAAPGAWDALAAVAADPALPVSGAGPDTPPSNEARPQ